MSENRPGAAGEGFDVRVGAFDGPLDLLLHLVRANEVDILDIPIVEITRQYQAYLDLMRELNLDVAGEFMVRFGIGAGGGISVTTITPESAPKIAA